MKLMNALETFFQTFGHGRQAISKTFRNLIKEKPYLKVSFIIK
jgi:hypothetical protein